MELCTQEGEMPLPINSTYGGGHGHMIRHDPAPTQIPPNGPIIAVDDHVPFKKMVRYRECLKNHAASMGGNATDGCGEFMPSGEEGTIEALTCSACNCHRNFHRKEIEGEPEPSSCDCCYYYSPQPNRVDRKVILGRHKTIWGPESFVYPTGNLIPSKAAPRRMIMSYNMGSLPSESDEQEDGCGAGAGSGAGGGGGVMARPIQPVKKRFRTKFSPEQKEKMLNFAEKVGWKIQKQEEGLVQQFCQEVGVKRRVLKVWMHNNKHSLAKNNPSTAQINQSQI